VAALWAAAIGVLGGFSYVRNLIKADNPLPPVSMKIGPIGWDRTAPRIEGMGSLSSYLFDASMWSEFLLPGLSLWFGYGWWAALGLILLGMVLAIATGPGPLTRMLGCVAAVAFVGYLVQPQLIGVLGRPVYFASNLRYAVAAMALGLVLLPLSPLFARRATGWLLTGGLLAIVLVMQFDSAVWPVELRELRAEQPVRGADAVAGVVAGVAVLGVGLAAVFLGPRTRAALARRRDRRSDGRPRPRSELVARRIALGIVVVGVLFAGLIGLERFYLSHRYTRPEAATPFLRGHWYTWELARDIDDARIGYRPPALSYPLYGNRLSNHVEMFPVLNTPAPGQLPSRSREACMRFRQMVNDRRYDYVVLFSFLAPNAGEIDGQPVFDLITPELDWLETDPASAPVLRNTVEAVYRVDGRLDPSTCP
jgi:hypothetical protein